MLHAYLLVFGFMAVVVIVGTYLNSPSFKGKFGEWVIDKHLRTLSSSDYLYLNDLYLWNDDKTVQIDHMMISTFGLFVVETKNMKGIIKGREHDKNWTQIIYRHKGSFYNPLRRPSVNSKNVMLYKDLTDYIKNLM